MNIRPVLAAALLALQGCSSFPPQALERAGDDTSQVLLVSPVRENAYQARLSAWQRQGGIWHRQWLISAVIGKHGMAGYDRKREGDGRTPSGVYALGPAFGYAPSLNTGLEYRQATDDDFWVDDADSLQYNQWVHGPAQAKSFERMKRADNLYQYGLVIRYNTEDTRAGEGSAIFLHVWRNYKSPTAGCVAVNQRYLRKILRWLDKDAHASIILDPG